ncbi:MAG: UDP-3-O-(3-hydroxymyristoyl)glucosamine N-acyltransferase [Paracoccaceae bacterium]
MPGYRIDEIAKALSGVLVGDGALVVGGANEPALARADEIAVAMDPKYLADVKDSNAVAAILWPGADWQAFGLKAAIFVSRPRVAMAELTGMLRSADKNGVGVHPTAIIDATAELHESCWVGPFVTVAAGVKIGRETRLESHVSIGANCVIGANCLLQAGVRVGENVTIGDRFVAHPNVTIGADGFSYVTREKSQVEAVRETLGKNDAVVDGQPWIKIYSIGGVSIADDVEIGSGSNVDAGTIRATTIGAGTKIDALVQVGHNVRIGRNSLLCGQVGVAGSAVVGNNVVLGGQVGVVDNITVGDGVVAGAGSIVLSNVPAGRAVLGYPAIKMEAHIEVYQALRRLPRFMKKVQKSLFSEPE